jgi:hypothetical protein
MFVLLPVLVFPYNYSEYFVNIEFDRTGMHRVFRNMTVHFRPNDVYVAFSLHTSLGGIFEPMSVSDISAGGRRWALSYRDLVQVYRSDDDPDPAVFTIDYRMSTPYSGGLLTIPVVWSDNARSFPQCSFRITFHASVDHMQFLVDSDRGVECTHSVSGRTVTGVCTSSSEVDDVEISAALPRFFFSPLPAEIALLCVFVISFLVLWCGLWWFRRLLLKGWRCKKRSTRLPPLAVTTLVQGLSRARQPLLFLAGRGQVTVCRDGSEVYVGGIALPEADDAPYAVVLRALHAQAGDSESISGVDLDRALASTEGILMDETQQALVDRRFIRTTKWYGVLAWIVCVLLLFGIPFVIMITFTARSFLLPGMLAMITSCIGAVVLVVVTVDVRSWKIVANSYIVLLVLGVVHGGATFGLFWSVACGWNQITMMAGSFTVEALLVWMTLMGHRWSPKGVSKAGRLLSYLDSVIEGLPVDNDQEMFAHLSYLAFSDVDTEQWSDNQNEKWAFWQSWVQHNVRLPREDRVRADVSDGTFTEN